jgi:hypothetical protein
MNPNYIDIDTIIVLLGKSFIIIIMSFKELNTIAKILNKGVNCNKHVFN